MSKYDEVRPGPANLPAKAKWPDFELRISSDRTVASASTDTGRPVTPTFTALTTLPPGLSDENIHSIMREQLDRAYARAHPNGCPAAH